MKKTYKDKYDVIVVGGGASGLMASVSAAKNNKVLLIEKNEKLGRKLLLTGGGRCNLTSAYTVDRIIENIPNGGKFLHSAFSQFSSKDIMKFFTSKGIKLKEEDNGRIFPCSDSAKTVLSLFEKELKRLNVNILFGESVSKVITDSGTVSGVITNSGRKFAAKNIILATGGASFKSTGSSGDGYRILKDLGHSITDLYPGEVPITSDADFIKSQTLKGLSFKDIELKVLNKKGKSIKTHRLDMIFTHFGVSGPCAMRCSTFIQTIQRRENCKEVTLSLNSMPDYSKEELFQKWDNWLKENPEKTLKSLIKNWLPERYGVFLISRCSLKESTHVKSINQPQKELLIDSILDFRFKVNGTLSLDKGFVTCGGVSLKEINPKTMESKLVPGLFVCGELLDINGYTGGYNLTVAFSTGHCAGKNTNTL